ncbi:MAG: peptidylprolyl isomerase, partial [Deltaproteobacteria bacterium]|nr:peptidylprolyl isomerase [Deltaproteobacteria bacterium]
MVIEDRRYVTINYKLSLDSGEVVDQSEPGEPLGFIVGSGQIITGLEKALQGMAEGQSAKVTVEAEEGYGESKPELYRDIPRDNFPPDLKIEPGMGFEAKGPHGPVVFRVRSATDDVVIADFNHPLAGQRLHFDVSVAEVREPRAEELASLFSSSCGCDSDDCGDCGSSA